MAFPTTGVIDDFNRTAEGPPPSANWTTDIYGSGAGGFRVATNQDQPNTTNVTNYWNAATFGPDCEVYVDWVFTFGSAWLYLRLVSAGTTGVDGYYALFDKTSTRVQVFRIDNAVNTQLGANITPVTFADGNSVGADMVGSTLTVYKKSGGSWATLDTRSDATYTAAGNIGLGSFSSGSLYDNFSGGTIAGAAPPAPTLFVGQSNIRLA